jgi:tRNA pseudouridine38/39 synthase
MSKKAKIHPILERLGLSKANQGKEAPTPRDILNYLLQNSQLKEEDVQTAYNSLSSTNKTESANMVKLKSENQPLNYRTRHIALRFYYDGAEYSGLAENIGMETDQSVEKSLFAALTRTKFVASRAGCGYSRCGRTDRGVSSAGQVVAMHLKSNIPRNATWDAAGTRLVQDDELPKHGVDTIRIWVPPKSGTGPRVEKEVSEYPFDKILNNVLPPTIRILGWANMTFAIFAKWTWRRCTILSGSFTMPS